MTSQPVKRCDYCHEVVLAGAKKCKHCGEILDSTLRKAEARKARMPVWYPLLGVTGAGLAMLGAGYGFGVLEWWWTALVLALGGLALILLGIPTVLILRAVGRTMVG